MLKDNDVLKDIMYFYTILRLQRVGIFTEGAARQFAREKGLDHDFLTDNDASDVIRYVEEPGWTPEEAVINGEAVDVWNSGLYQEILRRGKS